MHERARDLIQALQLAPHPEGGYFREVFRSARGVQPDDERGPRPALTTIFFLLVRGQVSQWHRVRSDEVWHFYEGDALALTVVSSETRAVARHRLGPAGEASLPVAVVPAGCWQAARPLGAYALVGCTVGPGFVYEDFELLPPSGSLPDA